MKTKTPPYARKAVTDDDREAMKQTHTNRFIMENALAITAYARRKGWISERAADLNKTETK